MYFDDRPDLPVPVISLSETEIPKEAEQMVLWYQTGRLCLAEPGAKAYLIGSAFTPRNTIAVEVTTGLCAGYRGWTAVELVHELPLNVKPY
jgi:hypothetical protein